MQLAPIDPVEFATLYVLCTALAPFAFGALSFVGFFAAVIWSVPVAVPLLCITPLCSCIPCLPCVSSIPCTCLYLFGTELFGFLFGGSSLITCCHWGAFLLPGSPISCLFAIPGVFFFCIFLIPLSAIELIFSSGAVCTGTLSCCTTPGCFGCGPCFAILYDICGIGFGVVGIPTLVITFFAGTITTIFSILPYVLQLFCTGSIVEACSQQAATIFQSESICEAIEIAPTLICSF